MPVADFAERVKINGMYSQTVRRGSALIMVLVALALMAGLAALFSLETLGGVQETRNFRDDATARWLARAGIEAALQEMALPQTRFVRDGWNELYYMRSAEAQEPELERLRKGRTGLELEPGLRFSWSIRLLDERADINRLNEAHWHRLFELGCRIPEGEMRTTLVNAILDWTDSDSNTRSGGAEEDYYQELDPPRHCKNAAFDSVAELLFVKGMTRAMLWGSVLEPREIGESNLLYGGGIGRYLDIGTDNNSRHRFDDPELKYILTGQRDETLDRATLVIDDEDRDRITNQPAANRVLLIGRGWIEGGVARHAITAILGGVGYNTTIIRWNDNAADDGALWEGYRPRED